MPTEPGQRNWLIRLCDYERPWVGRVALVLVLILGSFFSVVAYSASPWIGLAVMVGGGLLIFGEIWIERGGERRTEFGFIWHSALNTAVGALLLVIALADWNGWGSTIPLVFGVWLILWRVVLVTLWLRFGRDAAEPAP